MSRKPDKAFYGWVAKEHAPIISAVTVTLNSKAGFLKSRSSVVSQSELRIEHVVVDGGSEDGTVEALARDTDQRLTWRSESDGGIYDAMNKGVKLARGDLVLFLNAGDALYDTDVLKRFLARWYERSRALIYLCQVKKDSGRVITPSFPWMKRHWKMPTYHQGIIYPRKLLIDVPFDPRFKLAADYHNFVKLSALHPCQVVHEILVEYDTKGLSSRLRAQLEQEYLTIYREAGFGLFSLLAWKASEVVRKIRS